MDGCHVGSGGWRADDGGGRPRASGGGVAAGDGGERWQQPGRWTVAALGVADRGGRRQQPVAAVGGGRQRRAGESVDRFN